VTTFDRAKLDRMLRNEADLAAKHRVKVVLEYLEIRPQDLILDCGCGLGWFLKVIGELTSCRLVGLDIDRTRLGRARREVGGRAELVTGDAVALPFGDRTFDKVILSEVLEHLPDDLGALREVWRVLRPGGVVAITVPNHDYPFLWDPINWVRERLGLPPIRRGLFGGLWTDHLRLYYRPELIDLVKQAGFIVEDVRQLVHYCFPFAHNLVYGIGKPLVEKGLLAHADRFRYNERPRIDPVALGRWIFNLIDRLNHPISDEGKSTVCLAVKARKPY